MLKAWPLQVAALGRSTHLGFWNLTEHWKDGEMRPSQKKVVVGECH